MATSLRPIDVEMLNRSLEGVGNAFQENRREGLANRRTDIEENFRKQMLEGEMRRTAAAEQRDARLGEGSIDQWLQSDEDEEGNPGQLSHFTGPPSGLQKFMESSAQKGTTFRTVPPPTVKPPIMVHAQHPDGTTIAVQIRDLNDLDGLHKELKKQGFEQPKSGFETGPSHNYQSWTKQQQQAAALEQQAASESDATSTERQDMLARAQELRKNADLFFKPKPAAEPTPYTVPLPGGGNQRMTEQQYQANLPLAPTDPKRRSANQKYRTPKGVFTWTGTGWK